MGRPPVAPPVSTGRRRSRRATRPQRRVPRSRGSCGRPGVATVLAMLYLALFAVLAVGFYAATLDVGRKSRATSGRLTRRANSGPSRACSSCGYQLGQVDHHHNHPPGRPASQGLLGARPPDGWHRQYGQQFRPDHRRGRSTSPAPRRRFPARRGGRQAGSAPRFTQSGTFP